MTDGRRGPVDSGETASKVLTAGLFLALTWRCGQDFVATQRPTDLLLLVGVALVVVLTCRRRPAHTVDRRTFVRVITGGSLLLPMMVRPTAGPGLISEASAAAVAALGLSIVVAGKLSLGWSFGTLPANRGVIERGLYRVVRHPIYLGYLLTHAPFLAAHPSGWNFAVLLIGDAALVVRALYEEKTLEQDPQYVQYCRTVRWRLVPGIC